LETPLRKTMRVSKLMARAPIAAATLLLLPAWAQTPSAQRYSWPEPKHQVRLEESVKIPMRDGIKLSTDLYFPVDAGGKLPVILIRTPYNKAPYHDSKSVARHFASQGYIVAVQD